MNQEKVSRDDPDWRSDANLIAAAPDMLEALDCVAECEGCAGEGVRRPSDRQCARCSGTGIEVSGKLHWAQVRAAIAKARGES